MERKTKMYGIFVLVLLSILAVATVASAVPVTILGVEVNGKELTDDQTRIYERTDSLEVEVELEAAVDVDNVRVRVEVDGFEDELIEEVSDLFDMKEGRVYTEEFELALPSEMDRDMYNLRVIVSDRNSSLLTADYMLEVDTARHAVAITDIDFHPQGAVKAGSSLVATVEVENRGQKEEDVEVSISIPALGVGDEDDIDDLDPDEDADSEELWVRIDKCAAPGEYTVVVKADTGRESVTEERKVQVVDGGLCAPEKKTVLTVGSSVSKVKAGEKAIFPVTLANEGKADETYVLAVDGVDGWATALISPESVVSVDAGETSTVFVYVTPDKKAEDGQKMFTLTVKSGDDVLKQVALSLEVEEKSNVAVRVIEVVLIVLVAVLVVLGLVIGFNKMKANKEEGEEEGQTYY
ncbi:hypothetical protein KY311_01255 [Candidatus Woesearchaeota archaeon]|nr:hypothetical protein [Candidatus Woesearchaeota archaeon]MBW3017000.1 hypothetical protein [Candidatus Woesearchaeota archaeon]